VSLCPLCAGDGGTLVLRGAKWRVIRADEANFPAFYRVVWADHVAEFSDLSPSDRAACMAIVATVEQTLRTKLQPTKINLAALGNMVPHLHWHVVARFADDTHFPDPVWAPARRPADETQLAALRQRLPMLDDAVRAALAASP